MIKFIEKWHLFETFEPWRYPWIRSIPSFDELPLGDSRWCSWGLFISLKLGSTKLVEPIFEQLVRHSWLDAGNVCQLHMEKCKLPPRESKDLGLDWEMIRGKFFLSSQPQRSSLTRRLAEVQRCRKKILHALWDVWNWYYKLLLLAEPKTCKISEDGTEESQQCQRCLMASLQQELVREGLPNSWLVTGCDDGMTGPLVDIVSSLLRVRLKPMQTSFGNDALHTSHSECDPTEELHEFTRTITRPGENPRMLTENIADEIRYAKEKWVRCHWI